MREAVRVRRLVERPEASCWPTRRTSRNKTPSMSPAAASAHRSPPHRQRGRVRPAAIGTGDSPTSGPHRRSGGGRTHSVIQHPRFLATAGSAAPLIRLGEAHMARQRRLRRRRRPFGGRSRRGACSELRTSAVEHLTGAVASTAYGGSATVHEMSASAHVLAHT
jgi:hypothetical protein